MDAPPLSSIFDLSDISDAGAEVPVVATAAQRTQLAGWAGVNAVEAFEAQVTLQRRSANRFAYDARLTADVVQTCVITLEPVRSHLALEISRTLHLTKFPPSANLAAQELSPGSDEGPEEIQDSHYDVAGPLLEELLLAVDPYPRCPGVAFEPPADQDTAESPFGVLKSLKRPD